MTADEARRVALKMKKAVATDTLETTFEKKTKTPNAIARLISSLSLRIPKHVY